jgi:hypothetical protein
LDRRRKREYLLIKGMTKKEKHGFTDALVVGYTDTKQRGREEARRRKEEGKTDAGLFTPNRN